MDRHRARHQPRCARAHAPAHRRLGGRLAHARVVGEPEVVVRAQQQHRSAVEQHRRPLRPADHPQATAQGHCARVPAGAPRSRSSQASLSLASSVSPAGDDRTWRTRCSGGAVRGRRREARSLGPEAKLRRGIPQAHVQAWRASSSPACPGRCRRARRASLGRAWAEQLLDDVRRLAGQPSRAVVGSRVGARCLAGARRSSRARRTSPGPPRALSRASSGSCPSSRRSARP